MHKAQKIFCELVFTRFADRALNKKVLDVGSRNINGTNRYLFKDCD